MSHSFTVFIDESGCEGFKFLEPPSKGSSDWFVVSAVVTMSAQQGAVIELARKVREGIGLPPKGLIHWTDLTHERRVRVYSDMGAENLRYVSVLIDKRQIRNPEVFQAARGRLYYYAVRLLLERVSWLCRDTAQKRGLLEKTARIIFEHRKRLKHQDMVDYVNLLKRIGPEEGWIATNQEDIRIVWDVVSPEQIETAQKHQYAGLQLADMVASGLRCSLEAGPYGFTEHRYVKGLIGNTYKRGANFSSYGLKFFPTIPSQENDFMHWYYKHCIS